MEKLGRMELSKSKNLLRNIWESVPLLFTLYSLNTQYFLIIDFKKNPIFIFFSLFFIDIFLLLVIFFYEKLEKLQA
jgi:fumarate reductase subunit C